MENDKLREAAEQALGSLKALGAEYGYAAALLADALNDTANNPSPGNRLRGLRTAAQKVRDDYERAYGRVCDCTTPDSALHYGRAQGLEIAADMLALSAIVKEGE